MATRIITGGKVTWTNARPAKRDIVFKRRSDQDQPETPEQREARKHPIPAGTPLPPQVGSPFRDPDDGVMYRVVSHLDLAQGWMLASQVMKRYDIEFADVVDWALRGLVDPAMEYGSPVRRYRVRDDAKLRVIAKELHVARGYKRRSESKKAARKAK